MTVSIVTHKQWDLVRPLLAQLEQYCMGVIDQVILTINVPEPQASTGEWRLPIRRIENAIPRGFGSNHNAAFRHCRTPWFLVLNPDVRLEADVLTTMLALAHSRSGLLAPRIQEPGSREPEPYRSLLTPWELLQRRRAGYLPPAQPAWVAGMFMLVRKEAFQQIGGFDARYFMYCEDFDLCARLRLAGWDLQVTAGVLVMHEAQRASNSSIRPLLWHLASFAKVWTSGAFWRYARLLRRERSAA